MKDFSTHVVSWYPVSSILLPIQLHSPHTFYLEQWQLYPHPLNVLIASRVDISTGDPSQYLEKSIFSISFSNNERVFFVACVGWYSEPCKCYWQTRQTKSKLQKEFLLDGNRCTTNFQCDFFDSTCEFRTVLFPPRLFFKFKRTFSSFVFNNHLQSCVRLKIWKTFPKFSRGS